MPTRAQIAKKFRSEEARDRVTMSSISEWERYFFFFFFLRPANCVVAVFFLRLEPWRIFNCRTKFSMGSQTSMCNMNVILPPVYK